MNSEPEIVQNNTESKLYQPKSAEGHLPFLKTPSLISTIYKWNSTGVRVVLNLPIVSNDQNYLFLTRFGPFISHFTEDSLIYDAPLPLMLLHNFALCFFDWSGAQSYDSPPVHFTQYELPPLLSILARCYRRWRGDIEYRFRVNSNFGNQGILGTTPVYNTMVYSSAYRNPLLAPPYVVRRDTAYTCNFANSYQYQDASMFRHAEMRMKYQKPTEWVDQFGLFANLLSQFTGQSGTSSITLGPPDPQPYTEDFIGVFLKGQLPNSASSTNQIEIEIDYRACENFEFAGECLFPNTISNRWLQYVGSLSTFKNVIYDGSTTSGRQQILKSPFTWPTTDTSVNPTDNIPYLQDTST